MSGWLEIMRVVAEPTRVRIMGVLQGNSLSVAELQQVFDMGQSRISMHLRSLKKAGLVEDHRDGQRVYYRWREGLSVEVVELIERAWVEGVEQGLRNRDIERLAAVLRNRRQASEFFFNQLEERSRDYAPGRSWQAMCYLFLELIDVGRGVLVDMGSGEGMVTLQVAPHMKKVIAVDISEKMLESCRIEAQRLELENVEFRSGDMEKPPVEKGEADVVIFSQALHHASSPQRALCAAWDSLKAGGKMVVLDVNQHNYEDARTLYGDVWLGFRPTDLEAWLHGIGFKDIRVRMLDREEREPHFHPFLAVSTKPR
jgi:DNA-binding transcriptional ArsR family regulator